MCVICVNGFISSFVLSQVLEKASARLRTCSAAQVMPSRSDSWVLFRMSCVLHHRFSGKYFNQQIFPRSMRVTLIFLGLACTAKMSSFLNCRHSRCIQEVGWQYPVLGQWDHRPQSGWRGTAEPEEEASQSTHPGGAGQL